MKICKTREGNYINRIILTLKPREFLTLRDALRTQLAVNNTLYKEFHWNGKEEEIKTLKRMIKEMEAE